jgi:hypothetical protein
MWIISIYIIYIIQNYKTVKNPIMNSQFFKAIVFNLIKFII